MSRSEQAWDIVRDAILSGKLAPGTALKTTDLQELCGMSVSPVREALSRLVATGLVTAEHNRGYRVSRVSRDDLDDLVATRIRLESWALEQSIRHGDEMWEARILSTMHVLDRLPRRQPEDQTLYDKQWETRHIDYHQALICACGSPITLTFCDTLRDQNDRYRRLSLAVEGEGRNAEEEHRVIAQAAISRDAPRAIAALTSHYSLTAQFLRDRVFRAG